MERFETYVGTAGEWTWLGDRASGTSRAAAMLAVPGVVGNRHVKIGLARIPAGQGAPLHVHHDFEEFVYVLEGVGELLTDRSVSRAIAPGSINIIAPGTTHAHRNVGDRDLVFLWGYAPPGEQTVD
jgi:quercetin dioxygenase-like cupin family protein